MKFDVTDCTHLLRAPSGVLQDPVPDPGPPLRPAAVLPLGGWSAAQELCHDLTDASLCGGANVHLFRGRTGLIHVRVHDGHNGQAQGHRATGTGGARSWSGPGRAGVSGSAATAAYAFQNDEHEIFFICPLSFPKFVFKFNGIFFRLFFFLPFRRDSPNADEEEKQGEIG